MWNITVMFLTIPYSIAWVWVVSHISVQSRPLWDDFARLWVLSIPLFAGQFLILQGWRIGLSQGISNWSIIFLNVIGAAIGMTIGYYLFLGE